ncbi:unnamed protein product, partial [Didymodactylos carnosus]
EADLDDALQNALNLNFVQFVDLLVKHGASIGRLKEKIEISDKYKDAVSNLYVSNQTFCFSIHFKLCFTLLKDLDQWLPIMELKRQKKKPDITLTDYYKNYLNITPTETDRTTLRTERQKATTVGIQQNHSFI